MHKYSCTCIDNLVRGNMCKHIHAVVVHQGNTRPLVQDRFSRDAEMQELAQAVPLQPSALASVADHRVALNSRLAVLQDLSKSVDQETAASLLAPCDRMIERMMVCLKSRDELSEHQFILSKNLSVNEKCRNQRQFHAVKKQKVTHKPNLSKPSNLETVAITENLLHGQTTCTESDHTYCKR